MEEFWKFGVDAMVGALIVTIVAVNALNATRLLPYKDRQVCVKALLALIVITLLLVGCKQPNEPTSQGDSNITVLSFYNNIDRYVDSEAGVVCWIYFGYQKGGIDCMPIEDTRLGE